MQNSLNTKTFYSNVTTGNRFSLVKTVLSDYAVYAIVDTKLNKVVCHLQYDNGEEYCEEMAIKMLAGLNSKYL